MAALRESDAAIFVCIFSRMIIRDDFASVKNKTKPSAPVLIIDIYVFFL